MTGPLLSIKEMTQFVVVNVNVRREVSWKSKIREIIFIDHFKLNDSRSLNSFLRFDRVASQHNVGPLDDITCNRERS